VVVVVTTGRISGLQTIPTYKCKILHSYLHKAGQ
jgi:hypothetical protein